MQGPATQSCEKAPSSASSSSAKAKRRRSEADNSEAKSSGAGAPPEGPHGRVLPALPALRRASPRRPRRGQARARARRRLLPFADSEAAPETGPLRSGAPRARRGPRPPGQRAPLSRASHFASLSSLKYCKRLGASTARQPKTRRGLPRQCPSMHMFYPSLHEA